MTETGNAFVDDSFARYVGVELIEAGDAGAAAQLVIRAHHLNGAGVVHGGAIFTLAAWTMAVAANSIQPLTLGLSATISWVRPVTGGTLTARATQVAAGGKVSTWHVTVTDEGGQTVAVLQGLAWCKRHG
ncbi:MAG: PaaI family thioesterase [Phycisphaerae bacterium]|nr:PaaI family thioesterase [Phycisphaerae bacterium]